MGRTATKKVISVGECMVELAGTGDVGHVKLGFGGDTLNTAVYLSRLLSDRARVSYMTRLGDDAYSRDMMAAWRAEGVGTDQVEVVPGRLPGLYAIRVDEEGERSFTYWRKEAPVRALFTEGEVAGRVEALRSADAVFFSGITLSILPEDGRVTFLEALAGARDRGAMIVFDPNHRPVCWSSTAEARGWYEKAYRVATVAIAGLTEEQAVFGDSGPEETLSRLKACGCSEIVVRDGVLSTLVCLDEGTTVVKPHKAPSVRDTTAAGDSFNAGYMAGRIAGHSPEVSVKVGHDIAAKVIQHPGAIIPAGLVEPL